VVNVFTFVEDGIIASTLVEGVTNTLTLVGVHAPTLVEGVIKASVCLEGAINGSTLVEG